MKEKSELDAKPINFREEGLELNPLSKTNMSPKEQKESNEKNQTKEDKDDPWNLYPVPNL